VGIAHPGGTAVTLRRAVFITGIVVLCAWTLVPIYLIALGAVGGRTVVNSWPKPFLPPADLSLATIRDFLDIAGVWSSALYSVEAAVLCMAFSILLGVPAGYALARFAFTGATAYRLLVLLTRAFPVAILALPLTVGFIRLGLYDTPLGVSLMHTALALPFAVLVSASLFQAIPRELEEAAWVFGCSPVRGFLRIVLPLALPGIAATAIFAFVISWNEVFAASVLTVRHKTLTAYLLSVLSESPPHVQFAGGFVLIIPSVLFIFLVRKRLFSMWGIANR
jgi:multiple sugar transport system permease protein